MHKQAFLYIFTVLILFSAFQSVTAQETEEYIPLEPKDNMWELSVNLDDIGVLDLRGLRDVFIGNKEDTLAKTLKRDDLPPPKRTEAEQTDALLLRENTLAKKYMYVIFTLTNITQKPVIDEVTQLPKVNADGKVEYDYVAVNTLKMNPEGLDLDMKLLESDLLTRLNVFLEMDVPSEEMDKSGLWPKRLAAIDVRLEKKMTAKEKADYISRVPYITEFLRKTSEFDLVTGPATLPKDIPIKGKIRGVAFFGDVPKDIDKFAMYFTGVSNQYRVKRDGKEKKAYYRRVGKFTFTETGDEFEIDRELLDFVIYERVYRKQYMGLDPRLGIRRLENWEEERKKIEDLDIGDPVEKWESDETHQPQ